MSTAPQFSTVRELIRILRCHYENTTGYYNRNATHQQQFSSPKNLAQSRSQEDAPYQQQFSSTKDLTLPTPPVVSIISSFYNAHHYFEETYRAIIYQTWQNFEWIIVDDCSTDAEAIALFNSLPQKNKKIKTFKHSTNQGLSAGRNTAISHAQGKYLFFIDLDDMIDPTYIEKCVIFLETHPIFSFVNSYSVGFQAQEYWWNNGFTTPANFIQQNQVTGRLLYRTTDFNQLGGFDETLRVYGDWERWLRAIVNEQKGWTIPEYLDCYRRTESGLLGTSLKNPQKDRQEKESIQSRYKEYFKEQEFKEIQRIHSPFAPLLQQLSCAEQNPLNIAIPHRILCFFPFLEVGGADRFNLDFISILAKQNYQITIATTLPSYHPWQEYFYKITPAIFHLPNYLEPNQWLAFTKYLIQSRAINLVFISNSYIAYYFLPFLTEEFPNVTFADLTHTTDSGWRGDGYPRVSCQFTPFLDAQIVTSQFLAKQYEMLSTASKKRHVCYTCIDTEQWIRNEDKRHRLRSQLQISENVVVLLFPARLVQQKRPLFLVDLIHNLTQQFQSFKVLVLGEGELKMAMVEKIEQQGLTAYFHLLPPVSPTAMLDFYSAADILLLPSAYEGISLAIYEAMAMELPVVAADVGGQGELVTPETGTLVPVGAGDEPEIEAYVDVLLPLLQNTQLRQQQKEEARQRVVQWFNRDCLVEQIQRIFTEAMRCRQTYVKPRLEAMMATELLLMALEYQHQEGFIRDLWLQKCQLEAERHELAWKKRAMESSKFWKLRRVWFKVKRGLGLTEEELW
ncbi:glycosyltransferase [Spirulina sp. CS-785/01]|uniref:glycosyltransferase n=1 Tax=Spirulina sp. CS-785/01 TaxID=3021716 RepID=UPI002330393C|nr:glycosyltransferase [Spirulina sp. CS-785/01]MDB9315645.1 glycosyltransferase [Spirulina sp. CS-785/01]